MKFALDQNFPVSLVKAMVDFIPPGLELLHVHKLDPAFAELSDADLVVALSGVGIDCLITTDYHMLDDPDTVSAIVETKMNIVVVQSAGHDPLRASGALFLELPGIADRLAGKEGKVIYLPKYKPRVPQPAWNYLKQIALKQGTTAEELFKQHKAADN